MVDSQYGHAFKGTTLSCLADRPFIKDLCYQTVLLSNTLEIAMVPISDGTGRLVFHDVVHGFIPQGEMGRKLFVMHTLLHLTVALHKQDGEADSEGVNQGVAGSSGRARVHVGAKGISCLGEWTRSSGLCRCWPQALPLYSLSHRKNQDSGQFYDETQGGRLSTHFVLEVELAAKQELHL